MDNVSRVGSDPPVLGSRGCTVSRLERRWVAGFAVLISLATTLPYGLAFAVQGTGWQFTGFVFGVEDGNSYIAKMLAGSAGAWLFRTPYTAMPQAGTLVFLPYLLLGKLAAPPGLHEQLVVLYHLFRIASIFLACLATYDFLAFFLSTRDARRLGLVLALLGGGLGWVLAGLGRGVWLGSLPLDFISPESFGFLGIFGVAHLGLSRSLLLWALLSYLRLVNQPSGKPAVRLITVTGALWLLAGLAQPLASVTIGAVIALYWIALASWQIFRTQKGVLPALLDWRRILGFGVGAGILPALYLAYNFWSVLRDPFLRSWSAQNLIQSPHPLHYLLAYGLLLPFACWGGRRLLTMAPKTGWLPVAWVLALPLLVYFPVNLQRRLPEGVWVAFLVLALSAYEGFISSRVHSLGVRLSRIAFALLLPSSLFLLAGGTGAALHPAQPVFRPAAEVDAFRFLSENAEVDSVVLASYETGNALPAWAPVRVLAGHGPESAGLANLLPRLEAFYSVGTPDSARLGLMNDFQVHYVFWGPAERALGGWDPEGVSWLEPVYQSGGYAIFEAAP